MIILAIEHSTATGSIALLDDENILQKRTWQRAAREPSMLIEQISQILTTQSLSAAEIDIFAVGQGPGIYSNLRISLSVLNGLALPDKKPVYGISSAAALVHEYRQKHGLNKITVIGDARRNRVWYAPFTINWIECQPPKLEVVGSIPARCTILRSSSCGWLSTVF